MIVHFFDRQHCQSPFNGSVIADENSLSEALGRLRTRDPSFCELVGDHGFNLLVGVGRNLGCAQFSPTDGGLPYEMAIAKDPPTGSEYLEFLMGNTLSPVPARYCLPFDMVYEIASQFVATGEKSRLVQWEDI